MRLFCLVALALPLMPIAAFAQPLAKAKTFPDCAALVASVTDLVVGPQGSVEDVEGGCRARNVSYAISSIVHYTIDEVTLLTPGLLTTFSSGEVFESAELDIKGLRMQPQTHSPLQDYILALTTIGVDLRLAYTTEPDALTSAVSFELGAGKLGRLAISADLSDFDNTDIDLEGVADATGTLNLLDVTLEDSGLFVTMFAPAVLNAFLPQDEDPRPSIAAMQETAVAALAGLPADTLSPASLAVLDTLIRAFPNPEGDWHVRFESADGISFESLTSDDPAALATILADARIRATGEPAAP